VRTLSKKGSDTKVKHALDLYYEQAGPSQAAGGSANGLTAYLEVLSFWGIERILRVSYVTVMRWVRWWGRAIGAMRKEAKPEEVRRWR